MYSVCSVDHFESFEISSVVNSIPAIPAFFGFFLVRIREMLVACNPGVGDGFSQPPPTTHKVAPAADNSSFALQIHMPCGFLYESLMQMP